MDDSELGHLSEPPQRHQPEEDIGPKKRAKSLGICLFRRVLVQTDFYTDGFSG